MQMEVSGKQIGAMAGKPATLFLPRRAAHLAQQVVAAGARRSRSASVPFDFAHDRRCF